jgi:RNA methyltransferase, TrmH family
MSELRAAPTRRQITEWARLTQKKFRREGGRFLIEGRICVAEALAAHADLEAILVLQSAFDVWETIAGARSARSAPVYALNTETFDKFAKVESSQGIVAVGGVFHLSARTSNLAMACEQVSDPGNCGALLRVADFFGASELILGPDSAEIWNPKVVRGSMGSIFHQPVRADADLAEIIKSWPGSSVATVSHGGQPLRSKPELPGPVLLVLGHETRGLSPEIAALCTHQLTLEPQGQAESLNLVTAAAVFAYALS